MTVKKDKLHVQSREAVRTDATCPPPIRVRVEINDGVVSVSITHLTGTQPQENNRRPYTLRSFPIGLRSTWEVMERVL